MSINCWKCPEVCNTQRQLKAHGTARHQLLYFCKYCVLGVIRTTLNTRSDRAQGAGKETPPSGDQETPELSLVRTMGFTLR